MQLYDFHTHSRFSQDGKPTIFQMCQAALEQGLAGLAITDHFDLSYDPIGFPFYIEWEKRREEEFLRAREQYGDRLELFWGLELGNPQYYPDIARAFLDDRKFDFLLGSVHFLPDGRDIYLLKEREQQELDHIFAVYFGELLRLIQFGGFDSLAHLDYPLRIMNGRMEPSVERYQSLIEPVLQALVERDLALEINTRGWMDWKERQEPEDWVLRRFRQLGGRRVTLGSDAHQADVIGFQIRRAAEKAAQIGWSEITVYRGREPIPIPLAGSPLEF